jgi:hypothetical protein
MDGRTTPDLRLPTTIRLYPNALNAAELERDLQEDGARTKSA